ncbi:hypothetical protein AAF712_008495 [Marasmius tenuissimus]|uniref:Mediator of RNA polymerase II transcription subunit 8 n=1 Tax=Marasmius tenuissimus TaxID=585030 RepID=A0ABR2ZTE1_9AGAR
MQTAPASEQQLLLPFDPTSLPIAQLESLKFKANQIIESIQSLQRTIDVHHVMMSAWPDLLSKYNVLLSQTHNFSTSLSAVLPSQQQQQTTTATAGKSTSGGHETSPYEKIALHPQVPMSDTQLDGEIIPLLRNQQTIDVLNMENETVRRLSEHTACRGSLGVLSGSAAPPSASHIHPFAQKKKKPEYEDVLAECAEIRGDHDRRAERAIRAVALLRDKFEWKARVAVEMEEPEELDWDPRVASSGGRPSAPGNSGQGDGDVEIESASGEDSDEDEVEGHLVDTGREPPSSPSQVEPSTSLEGDVTMNMG